MTPTTAAWYLLLVAVSTPVHVLAWGPGGHMVISAIAEPRLNPIAKANVQELLAVPIAPRAVTSRSKSLLTAGLWADDVRGQPDFEFAAELHYINLAFSADGTRPSRRPGDEHIVRALERYTDVLRRGTDRDARAQALRFVIHFVGDVHQPLHCATRVDAQQPDGDRGGNSFRVVVDGRETSLHRYWDSGLDSLPKGGSGPQFARPPRQDVATTATALVAEHAVDARKLQAPFAFRAWADESHALARSAVYAGITTNKAPSARYIQRGSHIARERIALAGYRLAALLNAIWPPRN